MTIVGIEISMSTRIQLSLSPNIFAFTMIYISFYNTHNFALKTTLALVLYCKRKFTLSYDRRQEDEFISVNP